MNTWLLAGGVVLAIACGFFAWRYIALRRRLAAYARALRHMPPLSLPMRDAELEDLSIAVRSIVSDFNQQLASLQTGHDRLAAVLDQMTDGVLIADATGVVQFANPAARRLFSSPDAVHHTVTEVVRHHQLVEA